MVSERERRIGRNEALYRSVNERIEDLNEAFGMTNTMTVVCECGDASCAEGFDISVTDYERVRSDPTLFVIVPGHEIADVEDVVERTETFDVVRKREPETVEVARDLDPRSR